MNAIEKTSGPCVILAGAGTGKTYTIVEKIKHIINNNLYEPERLVCITFSNEAANNLLFRVRRQIDFESGEEPIIKTFHAFSAYLLRTYGSAIGLDKEFKILDPDSAKIMLHSSFKLNPSYCHKYVSSIGMAKDLGIERADYEKYLKELINGRSEAEIARELENLQFELQTLHLKGKKESKTFLTEKINTLHKIVELSKFVKIWNGYEKLKERKNSLDYSDLNLLAIKLLKNSNVADNFDCIIVDEFQDTNKVQLDFLKELARKGNITVVGDLNQSIYRFRGAMQDNLDIFKEHFKVKREDVFNLDLSRRSPNRVLRTAHELISNNYHNKEDCFFVENAHSREGEKIQVYEMLDGKEEARKIVELVGEEIRAGTEPEEICVMFRTHQQSRLIKKILEEKGIEYTSVGKNSLLKQNSIKLAMDYISLLNSIKKKQSDKECWWNLFHDCGLRGNDLSEFGKFAKDNSGNLNELILERGFDINFTEEGRAITRGIQERVKTLVEFEAESVEKLIEEVYRVAGLIDIENGNNKGVIVNLNKFKELSKSHSQLYESTLESFLYYLDIVDKLGIEIDSAEVEERGVRIMTTHATKGLEFKLIILTNMAEKRFPLLRISENTLVPLELSSEFEDMKRENYQDYQVKSQLMEERRLCYVAFTRAKDKLIITYAKEYASKHYLPSRFLDEIHHKENEDIEFVEDKDKKYNSSEVPKLTTFSTVRENVGLGKPFSPSALLTFLECQKMFEYKYLFNMPEKKNFSWEALQLGSFIHLVLEEGVKRCFRDIKDFLNLAKEFFADETWSNINLEEATLLIKVFFERNKSRYNEKSLTEQCLRMKKEGMNFIGFADRIDFSEDGLQIVDYKTGKTPIYGKERDWQLGYYALAASSMGKVRRVILDMLKQEKPIEFEIDDEGNAVEVINKRVSFNIYNVEKELIETAMEIKKSYSEGFKACPIEKNCEFCNEMVHKL